MCSMGVKVPPASQWLTNTHRWERFSPPHTFELLRVDCRASSCWSYSPELDCQVGMSLWFPKHSPYVNIRSDFLFIYFFFVAQLLSIAAAFHHSRLRVVPLAQTLSAVQQPRSAGAQQTLQTASTQMKNAKKKKTIFTPSRTIDFSTTSSASERESGRKKKHSVYQMFPKKNLLFWSGGFR